MSLPQLNNPLNRINSLPTNMNWRGVWNNTTQYYKNDVVLSPIDTASYVELSLSILGGADPSINVADWIILSPATTGLIGINAGTGISITGTPTNPTISNTGVLTATAGTGITNTNTATDPVFENTGLISLSVGTGLSSSGGQNPTLTNTGVVSITGGAGINVDNSNPQIPVLTNTGLLTLTAGTGITITAGQTPTITNSGLQSLSVGAGLSTTGGVTPTISLTATSAPPIMTFVQIGSALPSPILAGNVGTATVTVSPTSQLYDMLLNGSPDPNGVWVLDLSSICYYNNAPAGGTNTVVVGIEDTVTVGGPYTYAGIAGSGVVSLNGAPPYSLSLNKFYIDVAAARLTGLREFNNLLVLNDTGGNLTNTAWSGFPAFYYPDGIQ